ncbi:hypothetical protein MM213_12850 [Belliella sp. R4-6]|uniref:Uncharacterized protein n=1 Tax=Belliella alkalica TaxID=1730871 RepID=A0ABS9VD59_9BACT|nr:hypothetical protein [Belliella alkalica]MCH7414380.1 hypothetical protein [Belliella alkalica]
MSNQVEIGFWEINIDTGAIKTSKSLNEFLEVNGNKCISSSRILELIPNRSERFKVLRNIKKSITHNKSFSEIINFRTFLGNEPIRISIVGKPMNIGNLNPKITGIALKYNDKIIADNQVNNSLQVPINNEKPSLDKNLKKLCNLTIKQKILLTEVRYHISHNVMNHVANLLGLYDIYLNLNNEFEKKEFVEYMGFSILKLNNELRLMYERIEEVDFS